MKIVERLKKLLIYYNLSASNFADKIDVPRSSISHLLSGRNKPSLDFIMKVVENFEDVDLNWIVYGKGNFPKKITKEKTPIIAPTLFTKNEKPNIQKKEKINSTNKSIKKIIILYTDGTFEDYRR